MKKIIKVKQQDDTLLHLTWVINNICTNKCSYCPPALHSGSNHHYHWDSARLFFKLLFEKYTNIHCSVAGGEPSVSPFFPDICKIFHEAGHTIGVTSNAAKPATYWDNISHYLNYICFSYHPEFEDKKFIEKVEAAAKNTFVTARIMMHANRWDQCVEMYEKLMGTDSYFIEPVRILNWGGGHESNAAYEYSEEQLKWFEEHAGNQRTLRLPRFSHRKAINLNADFYFDDGSVEIEGNANNYINRGQTNFNGYACEAGLKSLFVDWQGRVFLGNCCINGSIGNINHPLDIQWPTAPVICNKNVCHCTSDVTLNKWIENGKDSTV
mgnify:CR=1 FL=1